MSDDQDAKTKQTSKADDVKITVISAEQVAKSLDEEQFRQPQKKSGRLVGLAVEQAPRVRAEEETSSSIGAGSAKADVAGARKDERLLLRERGRNFREAKQRSAVAESDSTGFSVVLLEREGGLVEGFLENGNEDQFRNKLQNYLNNLDKDSKIAIENNKLYIGVVEEKKGIIYSVLKRDYGFEQSDAMRLASLFDRLANGALREGVDLIEASMSRQGNDVSADSNDPSSVTARFADRPDKAQTPLEFLELHYGRWLRGNGLYQHTLRKLDKSLMQHLDRRFVGRRDELAAIIPNKRSEIDARLGPDAERMSPKERKRALDALRMKI